MKIQSPERDKLGLGIEADPNGGRPYSSPWEEKDREYFLEILEG